MTFDLSVSVVRVLNGTSIVGTGFIISDLGLIATCIHVLEEAGSRPDGDVTIQFQANKEKRQAQVVKCSSREEDVAILKVEGGLPPGARSLALGTSKGVRKAKSVGFPIPGETRSDVDVLGECTIFEVKRRLQLRSTEITRGFSGAPLCDEPDGFVIGMVAEILKPDEYGRLGETAYAVPSEILHDICPEIKLEHTHLDSLKGLYTIPSKPNIFVGRQKELAQLKELVHLHSITVLHGVPGMGKTVLAIDLAKDADFQKSFSGIFWIKIGYRSNLIAKQHELIESIESNPSPFTDTKDGLKHLNKLFENNSYFLILDDIWEMEQFEAFNIITLGTNSKILITTRKPGVLRGIGGEGDYEIDPLSPENSKALFTKWSDLNYESLSPENRNIFDNLVEECHNHPLTLAMVGAKAKRGRDPLNHILHMLKDPHLKKNDLAVKLLGVEYISVYSAFEISFNDLKKEEQERYLEFAIFPKGFGIPKKMLEIFWNKDGYNVEKLVNTLDDCSLVKVENDNVVLYDIQHDFIRGELSSDYKLTLNNKLLVACKNRYGDWYKMPNNGYLFQNLAFHLSEAGKYDELRKILLDIRWLDKKLEYADIFGLISDYDYLGKQASDMGETIDTRLWQDALRLSAHVLSLDRFQLPSQLLGRLQGFETHATKELLKQADSWAYPWLKPLKASLTTPDSPLQKTLNNHRSPVRALAIARENGANKAISGSIDGVIKVWDIESGREINSKKLYECPVRCLSITPDGKRAVSGSDDKMIRIWDLDSIKEVCSPLEGHEDSVRCIAVYSNGKMAVSGSDDTTLRIWDLTEGVKRGDPLKGHESSVRCVAITSSGEKCISGSIDGTLRVWDISDPLKAKCIGTLRHNDMVNAVAITHDGKMVLSGSARGTIKVWSLESMEDKPIALLEGHADAVLSVAVSPDDSRAVSGSYDNTLRIWNLKDICNPSGKAMGTLAGHANCVRAVGFSNDEIVLSVSDDETFKIWSLNKLGTVQERKCHTDWINVIDVIPDAKRAISASDDKILKIWDSQNGKWIRDLKDHKLPVRAMSGFIDENGDTCIVSGSYDTSLKIWNITKDLKFDLEGEQHEGAIRATAVTQDGKFAISGSYDGEVKVWNIKTHQLSKSLKGHKGPVRAVATNKEMVISGSYDGTIRVWNLLNKADDKEIPAHNGWVNKLAVIPNDMVVSASEDGTIKIWSLKDPDLKSPKATHILRGHDGPIRSMAVSSNGKKIITGSSNGTLNIWTVTENIIDNGYPERQLAIKDYNVPIKAVAISSDGEFGVAGYNDGSLRVLNLNTDEYVSFTGDSPIIAIAITPKENVIIAGETSGRIHFLSPIGFNFKFNKIYQKKKFNYKENESSTKHDKIQYALDKCVKETKSELGYLAAVDYEGDNPQKVQMIYWSEDASKKCRVAHKTSEYSKDMMGLWGEPLRRKTTCKVDNYLISTHREGYPDGHFPLKNFLSVPIFDELGKIPYIVAVANKKENGYSNDDEKVLTEIGRILGVTQEETRKLLPEGGG